MLVHSLASKYARFVVIVKQMYWTPPPSDHWTPLLKSDDLFFREPRDIKPPPFKNPGHAPDSSILLKFYCLVNILSRCFSPVWVPKLCSFHLMYQA